MDISCFDLTVASSNKNNKYNNKNFENMCAMLQKIMEYLAQSKRYPGRIFIKFERNESSFEILFYVCSIRIFTKFLVDPYYERS